MDPAGKTFTYDNVGQEEDAPDATGDIFEDEVVFSNDVSSSGVVGDNGNDGIMLQEGASTTAPMSPNVNSPERKVVCGCICFAVLVIAILAVVLTVDMEVVANRGRGASQKEQLITFLKSRGMAAEKILRDFSTAQGQALAFLAEEDWDGEMSWLYRDKDRNPDLVIERYVLSLIYFECEGIDWLHSYNFLSGQDHCDWNAIFKIDGDATIEGVTSCNEDGYVERLYFPLNNLRCQDGLPDEMEKLQYLEALVARSNEIEGEFPYFVRELTNLSVLSFGYNKMEGTLPVWIGEMTELSVLHLSDNTFVGPVPTPLNELTNLKYLGMDDNFFTGNLDEFLPSLVQLEWLYMEDNQFTGTLDWLDKLDRLAYLDMSKNKLAGNLPFNLLVHPNLAILDLHGNQFTGKLPTVSTTNPDLQLFSIHSNQLTGTIPAELSALVNITMLDLSLNSFTGTIPALSETTRLRFLMTSGNVFDKQEMPFLAGLTSLVELSMKGNSIVGSIPNWIGELTKLKWLDLDANELIGSIPSEIAKASDLYAVLLNRNVLDGTLPTQIAQLTNLEVLLIDGNSITGDTFAICNRTDEIDFFISDCGTGANAAPAQLDCPCCTTCCISGDRLCSDFEWTSVHDPIVENDFSRGYAFNYSEASPLFSKINDVDP